MKKRSTGVSNEKRIRFFPLPQEPLRETTQAPDHHSLGRHGGRLLQANGGGAWDALSEPDQFVSTRLRGAEAAAYDSVAEGNLETPGQTAAEMIVARIATDCCCDQPIGQAHLPA